MGAQLAAVARMLIRSAVNSLRQRQGKGALVVLPVLLVFLTVELARFGARSADGMTRVLGMVPRARAVHYASFWLLELSVALVALKYARVVPGRGSRKLVDTVLVRALPTRALTRTLTELVAASAYSAGVVALVMAPTLWGLCRHAHDAKASVLLVAGVALSVNVVSSLVAVALHEGLSRRLAGRALDGARVCAAVVGVGLMGLFTAAGPLGAGLARTLRTGTMVPVWSAWLPTRPLVRWILGERGVEVVLRALASGVLPAALACGVFAWRASSPADISLDAPWSPWGAARWERSVSFARIELRALLRQAPYLALAAPSFLVFFGLLAKGARSATGADLPLIVLVGLVGWAVVVMGTALSGAASRRWRRVLWLPAAMGRSHRDVVRGVAFANLAMTAPLSLGVLAVLARPEHPGPLWFARMVLGLLAALAVGQWTQSAALFLLIDPAPDRLTGLSVAGVFGVLAASLPTAGLVVMLSATPLAQWSVALAMLALLAWSLEGAAVARVRWIRDPDGEPHAETRAWPALRTFGLALMAQVLVMETLTSALGVAIAPTLVAGYAGFALVVVPSAWRRWRAERVVARWSRAQAMLVGAALGVANFALTYLAMRWWRHGHGGDASAIAGALSATAGAWKWALALTVALAAPAAEEVFFRGWLQHALKRDLGERHARWAFVVTAFVFAGMHAGEPLVPVLLSGLVLGALMETSGRLSTGLAFHLASNGLSVSVAMGLLGR